MAVTPFRSTLMKVNSSRSHSCWLLAVLSLGTIAGTQTHAQTPTSVITSVGLEGTNVVVIAQVPVGTRRVTLECRQRLGLGTWEPRAVARLDGTSTEATFRLPR